MLLALTAMWGTAFLLTKVAVESLPPELVVTGRLVIASALLLPIALLLGRRLPRVPRLWLFYLLIALLGNALPFSLISWGQRFIPSGVAGILMAVMPLATLGLAHFWVPGERLTRYRVAGFVVGFSGVAVLMGPDALLSIANGGGQLLPMLAVLAGAISYAVSAILARLRPTSDALTSAAATSLIATLMMLPMGVHSGGLSPLTEVPEAALWAVLALGVFSTALAGIVYFRLVKTAGPSFVSQLNYLIPLWAVLAGVVFLGEALQRSHLYALALILGGVLITQLERTHGNRPQTG